METLIFSVQPKARNCGSVVKIDQEAADIISEVASATGLSVRHIVSKMIKFCEDKWEME